MVSIIIGIQESSVIHNNFCRKIKKYLEIKEAVWYWRKIGTRKVGLKKYLKIKEQLQNYTAEMIMSVLEDCR